MHAPAQIRQAAHSAIQVKRWIPMTARWGCFQGGQPLVIAFTASWSRSHLIKTSHRTATVCWWNGN